MSVPTGKKDGCPDCQAIGRDRHRDNRTWYSDGSWYCHARGHYGGRAKRDREEQEELTGMIEFNDVPHLPIRALASRGIDEATAIEYGVRTEVDGETGLPARYYFPLFKDGKLSGYQVKVVREPGQRQKTDVSRLGDTRGSDPFGSQFTGHRGAMIIVVEGAEDAMAARMLLKAVGKNYRVVSTLGTDGWKRTLGFFENYQKVVIAYDQDDAGQAAAKEFAGALSPGKAVVSHWKGGSDPNALLFSEDGPQAFLEGLNKAEKVRPDGLVTGEEVWQRMRDFIEPHSIPYPAEWTELNAKMGGIRESEITMFTGGSSCGKTAYTRRIKHHILTNTDWKIGEVELEEKGEKTWRGVMEVELGKPWRDGSAEERRRAFENTYGTERIITLDHRSQYTKGQSLVSKFKHLIYGQGCKAIFLDHVTLAQMEFGDGQGNQAQDQMMADFLTLVESTGIHLFLVSHLRKTGQGGKSFEEGAIPCMDDLKGSGSLKQISFNIIGVSRNLQHEDEYQRNVSQLHILKCRESGKTGRADRLYWDDTTRSLVPAQDPEPPASEYDSERNF